ncbi:MAG: pseudouridine-5'-phosphate glycosidase, partial [Anaerolineae bacterium]
EAAELPWSEAEAEIEAAVAEAEERGLSGKALTPFLLARLSERTGGRSRQANEVLLRNNARVAARIARRLSSAT